MGFSLTVDDDSDGFPDNSPDDIVGPTTELMHRDCGACVRTLVGPDNQEIILKQAFHWDMLDGT